MSTSEAGATPGPAVVVFPVLDEAAALPWVLARVPVGFRPIVVDNGSTDGSGALAESLGAQVVVEPQRGFGAACWAGVIAAQAAGDCDVICFCDADASIDPSHLPAVADPVVAGRADLVLGARVAERGAWPVHARVANRYLAGRMGREAGVRLSDLGPLRAMRLAALLDLGVTDRRFGFPLEVVLRGARAGWRIEELPIPYHPRVGRSKVTGTVKGTLRAVRDMRDVLRS